MNKVRLGSWLRATHGPDLPEFALLAVLAVALAFGVGTPGLLLQQGAALKEVHPDHVVVTRDGAR